jgi:predicted SAM-dependent methyltransferase
MRLHLGSGTVRHEGWLNVDLDGADADLHLDLREPLPFESGSTEFIFNEHFIEHLTRADAVLFLRECRRVLAPAGVLRLSTPDLRFLMEQYLARDIDEWAGLWEPATPCRMVNEGMRLWGHEFLYDADELALALREAGFAEQRFVPWRESEIPELTGLESRPYHHELIVETFGVAPPPETGAQAGGFRRLVDSAAKRLRGG